MAKQKTQPEVASVEIQEEISATERVIGLIDILVREGNSVEDAVARAHERLDPALLLELFSEQGEVILRIMWRQFNRYDREHRLGGYEVNGRTGRRRHDLSPLATSQSIMEAMFPTGLGYRRLGGMTAAECLEVHDMYRHQAVGNFRKATIFKTLADEVQDRTVEATYSETELKALWEKGLKGDL